MTHSKIYKEEVPLEAWLDQHCVGWRSMPLRTLNSRLAVLGPQVFGFYHRSGVIQGRLYFERMSSRNGFMWFSKVGKWITVEEYFRIQYNQGLASPLENLVRFKSIYDRRRKTTTDNLFPVEKIYVVFE